MPISKSIDKYSPKIWAYCCMSMVCSAGLILKNIKYKTWSNTLDRGGYYHVCSLISKCFSSSYYFLVNIFPGSRIKIYLTDAYWLRIIPAPVIYEPDIEYALSLFRQRSCLFLDCGANIGYWSIFTSSDYFNKWETLAIEASPSTFMRLKENAKLNDDRFECKNLAISNINGEKVTFASDPDAHAGAHIISHQEINELSNASHLDYVTSVTIDSLVEEYSKSTCVIVKLDVEGYEVNALLGAKNTLRDKCTLIIYEDHGKDGKCAVSDYVLNDLNMKIFHVYDDKKIVIINSVEDVAKIKVISSKGYNFIGCHISSDFYKEFFALSINS